MDASAGVIFVDNTVFFNLFHVTMVDDRVAEVAVRLAVNILDGNLIKPQLEDSVEGVR